MGGSGRGAELDSAHSKDLTAFPTAMLKYNHF